MKNIPRKFLLFGYSLSELMLLLVIVMIGIIVLGPTVIRSLNANLKGWEDSVKNSHAEPLRSAPPVIIPGCDCSWTVGVCGPVTDPGSGFTCPVFTHIEMRVCTPTGCAPGTGVQCIIDPSCCDSWANTGLCGAAGHDAVGPGSNPDGTCQNGYMLQVQHCGNGIDHFQCVVDPVNCPTALCVGEAPVNATLCPGDNVGLTIPTPIRTVLQCTSERKCEYVCDSLFMPDSLTVPVMCVPIPLNVSIYEEHPDCRLRDWDSLGAWSISNKFISKNSTCQSARCFGGSFYNCSGSCNLSAAATCPNTFIGHLTSTPNAGGPPVYEIKNPATNYGAGCSPYSSLSEQSYCSTSRCGNLYRSCASGNPCNSISPTPCSGSPPFVCGTAYYSCDGTCTGNHSSSQNCNFFGSQIGYAAPPWETAALGRNINHPKLGCIKGGNNLMFNGGSVPGLTMENSCATEHCVTLCCPSSTLNRGCNQFAPDGGVPPASCGAQAGGTCSSLNAMQGNSPVTGYLTTGSLYP